MGQGDREAMGSFMNQLYTELNLKEMLSANYKHHYTDKGVTPAEPETAEHRMLVFDGDFFRRLFTLILPAEAELQADVVAFMQYKVIRSAGEILCRGLFSNTVINRTVLY